MSSISQPASLLLSHSKVWRPHTPCEWKTSTDCVRPPSRTFILSAGENVQHLRHRPHHTRHCARKCRLASVLVLQGHLRLLRERQHHPSARIRRRWELWPPCQQDRIEHVLQALESGFEETRCRYLQRTSWVHAHGDDEGCWLRQVLGRGWSGHARRGSKESGRMGGYIRHQQNRAVLGTERTSVCAASSDGCTFANMRQQGYWHGRASSRTQREAIYASAIAMVDARRDTQTRYGSTNCRVPPGLLMTYDAT
jgi:hypothetical protein